MKDVKGRAGEDSERIGLAAYARVPASSAGMSAKRTVALVVGEGAIVRGGDADLVDDSNITAAGFIKTLRQVRGQLEHQGRGAAHQLAGR